jgi:hypothetical protein
MFVLRDGLLGLVAVVVVVVAVVVHRHPVLFQSVPRARPPTPAFLAKWMLASRMSKRPHVSFTTKMAAMSRAWM